MGQPWRHTLLCNMWVLGNSSLLVSVSLSLTSKFSFPLSDCYRISQFLCTIDHCRLNLHKLIKLFVTLLVFQKQNQHSWLCSYTPVINILPCLIKLGIINNSISTSSHPSCHVPPYSRSSLPHPGITQLLPPNVSASSVCFFFPPFYYLFWDINHTAENLLI